MSDLLNTLKFAIEVCTGIYAISFILALIVIIIVCYYFFKENKKDRIKKKDIEEKLKKLMKS